MSEHHDDTREQHHHTQVDQHRAVTEEEIVAAMSISSVPDEIRVSGGSTDETDQVVDGEGNLRAPAADVDHPGSTDS